MTNRIDYPDADAEHVIRSLKASLKANVATVPCGIFALDRSHYLSPTGSTYRFVDNSGESMIANNICAILDRTLNQKSTVLKESFRLLADKWYDEIRTEDSIARMTAKKSYLQVIALEPKKEVISLILKELETRVAPWFLALRILSGDEEVGRSHAGNFRRMAQDWIEWGKSNDYLR